MQHQCDDCEVVEGAHKCPCCGEMHEPPLSVDRRIERIRRRLDDHLLAFEADQDMPDALHDYVTDVEYLLERLLGKEPAK